MAELMTDFDLFWKSYPRRTAKGDARKAWLKLNPSPALVQEILEALVWQRQQPDWLKAGGQYVPFPASWLRSERWEDEPVNLPQFSERTLRSLKAIYGDGEVH